VNLSSVIVYTLAGNRHLVGTKGMGFCRIICLYDIHVHFYFSFF
jgi:hypothetical protein